MSDVKISGAPATVQSRGYRLKRVLDVVLSAVAAVATSPLWLVAALAVKLGDGGPVLYRQRRWGRDRTIIELYKFRTMKTLSDEGPQATIDDARVTRAGRVLRATGMDEIPQFLNILRGEMSLVGPRPLAIDEKVDMGDRGLVSYEEIEGFDRRLGVRPGLTGPATIYLPKDVSPLRKLEYDLEYIAHQSLWLDIKLIVLSVWVSLRGKWEIRTPKI